MKESEFISLRDIFKSQIKPCIDYVLPPIIDKLEDDHLREIDNRKAIDKFIKHYEHRVTFKMMRYWE
jgi:hypothetical protein